MKQIHLSKDFDSFLKKKHPWIYRDKFKIFEEGLKNGEFVLLKSFDEKNIFFGVYANSGLIAVRIFLFSKNDSLKKILNNQIEKRKKLFSETNSIRLIHGENDFFPGITIDLHNKNLVIMNYHSSLELISRWTSKFLFQFIPKKLGVKIDSIILSSPNRIGLKQKKMKTRIMRGEKKEFVKIHFQNLEYEIDLSSQKSGIYNDIRNLRRYILDNKNIFLNKKVLNLFSSNGFLSKILRLQGAKKIISIEDSNKMISIHEKNENIQSISIEEYDENSLEKNILIKADILKNQKSIFSSLEYFDIVIVDPPNLTNTKKDIEKAKKIYKNLILTSIQKLNPDGILIICSCSNRIHPNEFYRICKDIVSQSVLFEKWKKLDLEIDHPILENFPEGNYFKVNLFFGIN